MSKIKQLFRYMLPVLLLPLLAGYHSTVASLLAGWFLGEEALAAVGSTSMVLSMMDYLLPVIAIAAPVVTAILAENGKLRGARTAHLVSFIVFCGLFLINMMIEILLPTQMMMTLNTPASVIHSAAVYLRGCALSALIVAPAAVLVAQLVRRYSMILTFCLCIGLQLTSIVMMYMLTIVFGMGVAGLGIGSGISYVASSILPFAMIPVAKLYKSFGAR